MQVSLLMPNAHSFLSEGPEVYLSNDAFGFPLEIWSKEDLELIKKGCRQIMQGIGFTEKGPFKGLGVRGF